MNVRYGVFPHRADAFDQTCFNIHVDIFEGDGKFDFILLHIRKNAIQTSADLLGLLLIDNTLARQHLRMCFGPPDVIGIQTLLKADRGGELLYKFICRLGEAPTPELLTHSKSLLG